MWPQRARLTMSEMFRRETLNIAAISACPRPSPLKRRIAITSLAPILERPFFSPAHKPVKDRDIFARVSSVWVEPNGEPAVGYMLKPNPYARSRSICRCSAGYIAEQAETISRTSKVKARSPIWSHASCSKWLSCFPRRRLERCVLQREIMFTEPPT